jgi:hypothetical protein
VIPAIGSSRKPQPGSALRLYWFRFRQRLLPVTVHLENEHRFLWSRIYGVQFGPWFFGAIKGDIDRGTASK